MYLSGAQSAQLGHGKKYRPRSWSEGRAQDIGFFYQRFLGHFTVPCEQGSFHIISSLTFTCENVSCIFSNLKAGRRKSTLGDHLVCASQTSISACRPVIWGSCKTADFKSESVNEVLRLFFPNKLSDDSEVAGLRTRLRAEGSSSSLAITKEAAETHRYCSFLTAI